MTLPSVDPISNAINTAKLVVVGVFVIAALGTIGYLAYTKQKLETELAQAQTDITALTDANTNWKDATATANAALASEIADEKKRTQDAQAAVDSAQKQSDEQTKEANAIMAVKIPVDVSVSGAADPQCNAARSMMKSFFAVKK